MSPAWAKAPGAGEVTSCVMLRAPKSIPSGTTWLERILESQWRHWLNFFERIAWGEGHSLFRGITVIQKDLNEGRSCRQWETYLKNNSQAQQNDNGLRVGGYKEGSVWSSPEQVAWEGEWMVVTFIKTERQGDLTVWEGQIKAWFWM